MTFCPTGTSRVGYKKVFDYARSKRCARLQRWHGGVTSLPLAGEEPIEGWVAEMNAKALGGCLAGQKHVPLR